MFENYPHATSPNLPQIPPGCVHVSIPMLRSGPAEGRSQAFVPTAMDHHTHGGIDHAPTKQLARLSATRESQRDGRIAGPSLSTKDADTSHGLRRSDHDRGRSRSPSTGTSQPYRQLRSDRDRSPLRSRPRSPLNPHGLSQGRLESRILPSRNGNDEPSRPAAFPSTRESVVHPEDPLQSARTMPPSGSAYQPRSGETVRDEISSSGEYVSLTQDTYADLSNRCTKRPACDATDIWLTC